MLFFARINLTTPLSAAHPENGVISLFLINEEKKCFASWSFLYHHVDKEALNFKDRRNKRNGRGVDDTASHVPGDKG